MHSHASANTTRSHSNTAIAAEHSSKALQRGNPALQFITVYYLAQLPLALLAPHCSQPQLFSAAKLRELSEYIEVLESQLTQTQLAHAHAAMLAHPSEGEQWVGDERGDASFVQGSVAQTVAGLHSLWGGSIFPAPLATVDFATGVGGGIDGDGPVQLPSKGNAGLALNMGAVRLVSMEKALLDASAQVLRGEEKLHAAPRRTEPHHTMPYQTTPHHCRPHHITTPHLAISHHTTP